MNSTLIFESEVYIMTKLTVLVTDDDQDIRDGIEIYLKNEGYNVIKAKRWRRGVGKTKK